MFLKESDNISENENGEDTQHDKSNFGFNTPIYTNSPPGATLSTSDSAYDSMGGSPFSPVVVSKSSKTYQITPFLESSENDEVFNESSDQLTSNTSDLSSDSLLLNNIFSPTIFRPITSGNELIRFNSEVDKPSSSAQIRECDRRASLASQRSISTQTNFSMVSASIYRPNSAPLQEGIEEELADMFSDVNDRIQRNSTCNCFRSPMPDLIQPAFQNNNQILVSRLSLIGDQINESIHPQTSRLRSSNRNRRFSTSSISELTPLGPMIDLMLFLFNALDYTLPSRRNRRNTASSL